MTEAAKRKNPALTHMVMFANSETGNVLPASCGVRGWRAKAEIPLGLGTCVWGAMKKWVVLSDIGE